MRLIAGSPSEEFGGSAPRSLRHLAGPDELPLHLSAKHVTVQVVARDRLVQPPQLEHGELLTEKSFRIGLLVIARPKVRHSFGDDLSVVVDEAPGTVHWKEPSG